MKPNPLSIILEVLTAFLMTKQIMVMEVVISVTLLFVGIAILITIHICIVGRAFRRGFGQPDGILQRGSVPIIRGIGMSSQDLRKLPCFEYNEGEKGTTVVDCAVCLESLKVGDKCRALPNCHHCFHVQCIDPWLIKTPLCPVCRASARLPPKVVTVADEGSNSSSNTVEILL